MRPKPTFSQKKTLDWRSLYGHFGRQGDDKQQKIAQQWQKSNGRKPEKRTSKGRPDPAKGPARRSRGKNKGEYDFKARRRHKSTEKPKPRGGMLDTEFAKVKAAESVHGVRRGGRKLPAWTPKNQHGGRST